MRKPFLVLFTMLMFCAVAAFAQDTSSSSQTPNSPSAQAGSQSSTGTSGGEQTIDGCIIQQQTDYYIQPSGSGTPEKLSGSPEVASHVGHHVVVHGTQQATSASNAGSNNPGSSSAASSQSSSSTAGQTFDVTKVDMVSTNCPASMQGNTGAQSDTSNPK